MKTFFDSDFEIWNEMLKKTNTFDNTIGKHTISTCIRCIDWKTDIKLNRSMIQLSVKKRNGKNCAMENKINILKDDGGILKGDNQFCVGRL